LVEVAACASCEVLMEVDHSGALVGHPQGILSQKLRPKYIDSLNIVIMLINVQKIYY
jgi:hypothetical protein